MWSEAPKIIQINKAGRGGGTGRGGGGTHTEAVTRSVSVENTSENTVVSLTSQNIRKVFFLVFFRTTREKFWRNFFFFLATFFFLKDVAAWDTPGAQRTARSNYTSSVFLKYIYIVMSTLYIQREREPIGTEMWKLTNPTPFFNQWPSKMRFSIGMEAGRERTNQNVRIQKFVWKFDAFRRKYPAVGGGSG